MARKRNALGRYVAQGVGVDLRAGDNIDASTITIARAQHLSEQHGLTINRAALIARFHYGEDCAHG